MFRLISKTPPLCILSTSIASCGLIFWVFRRLRVMQNRTKVNYAIGMEKSQCKFISFEDALQDTSPSIFVDVRTPKEFLEFHVKDARSLPLMSDDQRHLVGWTYAHKSQAAAIATGWKVFRRPQMRKLLNKLDSYLTEADLNKDARIYVYCWRGGMRSRIVTNLLAMNGYPNAMQLTGGSKHYMNQIVWKGLEKLGESIPPFIVLFGNTGTRKTEILHALQANGHPVLDLEGLAGHKGSMYGAVDSQPRTQKQFSALLYHELERLKEYPFIFVEGEARKIGNASMPEFVYNKIQNDKKVLVSATMESRVQSVYRQYFSTDDSVRQLHEATDSQIMSRHIGRKNVEALHRMLNDKDYFGFIEWLLVNYYDIRYRFTKQEYTYDLQASSDDLVECCKKLVSFYETLSKDAI